MNVTRVWPALAASSLCERQRGGAAGGAERRSENMERTRGARANAGGQPHVSDLEAC